MPFTPDVFVDDPVGGTPITAVKLNRLGKAVQTADAAAAAAEPRVDRTGAAAGEVLTLASNGALAFLPAAGTGNALVRRKTASYTITAADNGAFLLLDLTEPGSLRILPDATLNLPIGTEVRFAQTGPATVTVESVAEVRRLSVRSGSRYVATSAATSHVVPMPVDVGEGDGLLVSIAVASTSVTITPPSDFVAVRGPIGPAGAGHYLFRKASSGPGDAGVNKTFTLSGTGTPIVAIVACLSNADPADFIDGFRPVAPDTEDDDGADPYVTVADGCLELSFVAHSSGTTQRAEITTPPAGTALIQNGTGSTATADANSRAAVAVSTAGPVPAGTTVGGRTWTAGYGSTATVAIRPATLPGPALRTAGAALKTVMQYADGVITKIGPDEWFVAGFLTT